MLFGAPGSLDPEDILHWLEVCSAGLTTEEREAFRLVGVGQLPQPHVVAALGIGAPIDEISDYFEHSRQEAEYASILFLTAAAEARIRDDAKARMSQSRRDDLAKRFAVLLTNARNVEWKIPIYENGVLDAWKTFIQTSEAPKEDRDNVVTSIGQFKNLWRIRNWIAHGRSWETPRGIENLSIAEASDLIEDLYKALRWAADFRGVMPFV
jgi:hypothetical protein